MRNSLTRLQSLTKAFDCLTIPVDTEVHPSEGWASQLFPHIGFPLCGEDPGLFCALLPSLMQIGFPKFSRLFIIKRRSHVVPASEIK